jgi:zinc-ribbon domain
MFCPECEKLIPDGSKFCPKCGRELPLMSYGPTTDEDIDLLGAAGKRINAIRLERQTCGFGLVESRPLACQTEIQPTVPSRFDFVIAAMLVLGLVACVSAMVVSCLLIR